MDQELWGGASGYGVGASGYGSLVIFVSAKVLLVLTLGLWTLDLGLTINSTTAGGHDQAEPFHQKTEDKEDDAVRV